MYCRNCGTYIDGTDEFCEACRMERIITSQTHEPEDMSKKCLGMAILSIILPIISFILSTMAVGMFSVSFNGHGMMVETSILCVVVLSVACTVIALIGGIRGIVAFKRASREGAIRPVASLVCGIIGLSLDAFAIIYQFMVIFAAVSAISSMLY